jgi:hypothetical protein
MEERVGAEALRAGMKIQKSCLFQREELGERGAQYSEGSTGWM